MYSLTLVGAIFVVIAIIFGIAGGIISIVLYARVKDLEEIVGEIDYFNKHQIK